MRRRPAGIERALERTRVAAALIAATTLLGMFLVGVMALGVPNGDILTDGAHDVDAARVATSPPVRGSTGAPTTTGSSTTIVRPTTAAPTIVSTTRPAPVPTARPATTPPPTAPPPTPATTATAAPTVAPAAEPTARPAPSSARCLVRLHGKGGNGSAVAKAGDVTVISPAGNAAGWGGKQWLYFAPSSYEAALAGVTQAIGANSCGQVIVGGFSNGGAFATKLFCRGESFDGRLVGVVADDPVPDHGADGCAPAPGVTLTIYWTGALAAAAQPGWNCAEQDWTCEGGTTVGIGTYAANAGTGTKKSPYDKHQWYLDAPELAGWR
jgi:hypothetical protein